MMSKVDAAEKILRECGKDSLSCKEIIDIALRQGLIETKGKTPAQTLRVDIKKENTRRTESNRPLRFELSSGSIVRLK